MTELGEKIIQLHKQGNSYNQIKEILGCSKGTIAYWVGAGQKGKVAQRNLDLRNKVIRYIQEYKTNSKCADCGENYPYWMLDFDHLHSKEFNISTFKGKTQSLEKVKNEIAKCDVVCANCHRNRTHFRQTKHGVYSDEPH